MFFEHTIIKQDFFYYRSIDITVIVSAILSTSLRVSSILLIRSITKDISDTLMIEKISITNNNTFIARF